MTVTSPEVVANYRLPALLDEYLEAVVNHYADAGVPLPDRQYWMIGSSAHDCEQVVLSVQQYFLGTPAEPLSLSQCNGTRSVTFTIEIMRCTPTLSDRGKPPTPESIQASSVDPAIDMEMLVDIAKYFDPDSNGVAVTIDVIAASGGLHGMFGTYSVTVI